MKIKIICPGCHAVLTAPAAAAGKTTKCPKCRLPIQIPADVRPEPGPASPPAVELAAEPAMFFEPIAGPAPVQRRDDSRRDSRRGDRRREDDDDEPRFSCPFCGTHESPSQKSTVTGAGWAIFAALLLVGGFSLVAGCAFAPCWLGVIAVPFCWVGLLIRDRFRVCYDCGTKLG